MAIVTRGNTPTPTPKEYVGTTNSMHLAIRNTLTSDSAVMCVVAEHINNPWAVMVGENPDYDGDDAFTRFWADCANAFYEAVNPTISAMMNNDHWND